MILHCIFMDWYLMVEYTATIHICTDFWNWPKRQGIEKVYVHCFLDGRDTPPASGKEYVEELEAKMKEIGVGNSCYLLWDVIMLWIVITAGIV